MKSSITFGSHFDLTKTNIKETIVKDYNICKAVTKTNQMKEYKKLKALHNEKSSVKFYQQKSKFLSMEFNAQKWNKQKFDCKI